MKTVTMTSKWITSKIDGKAHCPDCGGTLDEHMAVILCKNLCKSELDLLTATNLFDQVERVSKASAVLEALKRLCAVRRDPESTDPINLKDFDHVLDLTEIYSSETMS